MQHAVSNWLALLVQATEAAVDAGPSEMEAAMVAPILSSVLVLLATGGQDATVAMMRLVEECWMATNRVRGN